MAGALVLAGGTSRAVPRVASGRRRPPLKPLSASRSRGRARFEQVFGDLAFIDAAGTMLQARTIREPRSALMASRKP